MRSVQQHKLGFTLSILLLAVPLYGIPARAEPSEKDNRVVLQGQSLSATYVMKLKSRTETEALEITRLMFELAKKYPSATALTVAVRVDVSEADERYGIRDRGIVDLDQIAVKDLGSIRRASSYQSLLYGDYFWLPSKLQTSLDRMLKSAAQKH